MIAALVVVMAPVLTLSVSSVLVVLSLLLVEELLLLVLLKADGLKNGCYQVGDSFLVLDVETA